MRSSNRSRITGCCVVGVLALAGWGLTSTVQKVRLAAQRTNGL